MRSSTTGKKHRFTRRKILGATGLGLVGLAGAGGIQFYNWWQNDHLRPVSVYRGHSSYVSSIAWSPNSKHIATGDANGAVQIWERDTGNTLSTYQSHAGVVEAIAWSPDGRHIASAHGNADHVHVWEATTGHNILTYQGHSAILEVLSWAPDSKRIASGSYDGTIQVWSPNTGHSFYTIQHQKDMNIVEDIAWSPNSKYIASLTENDGLVTWDANTGSTVQTFQYTSGRILDKLAWSPDGKHICVFYDVDMGQDGGRTTGQIWDATTGKLILTSSEEYSCGLQDVVWLPDGKRIALVDSCNLRIWDLTRGRQIWSGPDLAAEWKPFYDGNHMVFSSDGKYLAGEDRNTMLIWEIPRS